MTRISHSGPYLVSFPIHSALLCSSITWSCQSHAQAIGGKPCSWRGQQKKRYQNDAHWCPQGCLPCPWIPTSRLVCSTLYRQGMVEKLNYFAIRQVLTGIVFQSFSGSTSTIVCTVSELFSWPAKSTMNWQTK